MAPCLSRLVAVAYAAVPPPGRLSNDDTPQEKTSTSKYAAVPPPGRLSNSWRNAIRPSSFSPTSPRPGSPPALPPSPRHKDIYIPHGLLNRRPLLLRLWIGAGSRQR